MKVAQVTYDTGDIITTEINGTHEEIHEYFAIGKLFNIGHWEHDKCARVVECIVEEEAVIEYE